MDDKSPPALATVLAGAKMPASLYVAGEKSDEVKTITLDVWVRQMPTRQLLSKVIGLQDDEPALIEAVCTNLRGQHALPENWVDSLTDESHEALLEKVRALNFLRAKALIERLQKITKDLEALRPPTTSLPSSSTTAPSSSAAPTTSSSTTTLSPSSSA